MRLIATSSTSPGPTGTAGTADPNGRRQGMAGGKAWPAAKRRRRSDVADAAEEVLVDFELGLALGLGLRLRRQSGLRLDG